MSDSVGRIKCIDNNGWDEYVEGKTYTVYANLSGCYIKVAGRNVPIEEVDRKIYWKKISGEVW